MKFSDEAKKICSINNRFENEDPQVQSIRTQYAGIADFLISMRNNDNSDKRLYSIALTELETSLMYAIKAYFN